MINQLVLCGDSLTQGTVGGGAFAAGGPATSCGGQGSWAELLADRLANIVGLGPLISSGFRGTHLGTIIGGPHNNGNVEWIYAGSWTGVESTDAFDKAPYGGAPFGTSYVSSYASGSGNTATWYKPASWRPIVGFAIYWVDYTSGGNWSYKIDGGAATAMGQTLANDNKLCKFYVASSVTTSVEIKAATTGGTSAGCLPIGIEVFYANPATTSGLIVHNLGINSTKLNSLVAATSGDRLAFFDQVKLGTGSPISNAPNIGTIVMHINDVLLASTSTWNTDLNTFYARVGSLGRVGILSYVEAKTASYNQTQQTNYRAQSVTTAAAWSTPGKVFSLYDWAANLGFTGNTACDTAGFFLTDLIHESQAGMLAYTDPIYWWVLTRILT